MFLKKKEYNYFISYMYREDSELAAGTVVFNWQPFTRIGHEITMDDIHDIMNSIRDEFGARDVIILSISRIGHEKRH